MSKTAEIKFVIGNTYRLKYSKVISTKRWRGTSIPSQFEKREYIGDYELIRVRGGKYHLYDQNAGIDILLSKTELKEAIQKN